MKERIPFPKQIKLGYADENEHQLQFEVTQSFHDQIREKLLEACGGELFPRYYRQLTSDPLRVDGSQGNIVITVILFDDITIGSIIERRTDTNYFELSFAIYNDGIAKIAERHTNSSYEA